MVLTSVIFLGVVTLLRDTTSFVQPLTYLYSTKTKSTLAYGPHDDSPPTNGIQKLNNVNGLDPACSIDDEDCIAFSTLDVQPLVLSNINEDPMCDPDDVECQAFLPKTYHKSDTDLEAELVTRSNTIKKERIDQNWRTAHCPTTFVSISNSDWVRRVAMETWPIAVCGGARGGVTVVNLEEKNIIGRAEEAHAAQVDQSNPGAAMAKQAMEKLYGKLDGGGVVAVAIHDDLIATSGREGGAHLWRIKNMGAKNMGSLINLGPVSGLQNTIVTSLKFDSNDLLWASCYDGTVHAYSTNGYERLGAFFDPKPLFESDFTDSVLDMDLCEELKLGVCATADGGAALFNMADGQFFAGLMLFDVAARSVLIVRHKDKKGYSVLCGSADGVIHRIPLNTDPNTGEVDQDNPFGVSEYDKTAMKPRHTGPVMCMESPDDDMFVSGGQDGTLRIWECTEKGTGDVDDQQMQQPRETKCLYALTGYKLWLGSACTDGKRLISDGGESSIVVRDYSRAKPGANGRASI